MDRTTQQKPYLEIVAGKEEQRYWKDLLHYRELLLILAWRDVAVRYKQAFLGITWALIQPLMTMVVLTVVFGKFAKLPSDGIPYPVLVYAGLLPWQFFATSLNSISNSLISNAHLLSKVYFPRLTLPVASVLVAVFDFLVSLLILVGLMLYFEMPPTPRILIVPVLIFCSFLCATSVGLWFCALNVRFRDFKYIVPFVVQFGLYVSPVGFSSQIVPAEWQFYYNLNPMVPIIEGFRWAITGEAYVVPISSCLIAAAFTGLLLYGGLRFFRKTESTLADII